MKIPKQAKLVFKGEIFDMYQWEQEMFDGSPQVFEMLKRPDTVQIIPIVGKKIWIAEEEQPHHKRRIGFLGGRVDEGENPLAAAKRELLEESGLQSDDWELYKMYEPIVKMQWRIYFYIARKCRKVQEAHLDGGEKIEIKEVSFNEFVDIFCSEGSWAGEFINDLLRMKINGELEAFKNKLFK